MPKLSGINHLNAIRAFEKVCFVVARQGKHVIMRHGERRIVIPINRSRWAISFATSV